MIYTHVLREGVKSPIDALLYFGKADFIRNRIVSEEWFQGRHKCHEWITGTSPLIYAEWEIKR